MEQLLSVKNNNLFSLTNLNRIIQACWLEQASAFNRISNAGKTSGWNRWRHAMRATFPRSVTLLLSAFG